MSRMSIVVGGLLSLWAIVFYALSGFGSITALIPLFIGAPIALFGVLAEKQPGKRKMHMHIAVGLALLGFLASASRIPALEDFASKKSISVLGMCVLCLVLLVAYVQSFLAARSKPAELGS